MEESGKFRLIHEVYRDNREVYYTEIKSRGLNLAFYIATKYPYQTDTWTMVENSVTADLGVAQHIFNHVCQTCA